MTSGRRPMPGPDAWEMRKHCPPVNRCGWLVLFFYGRRVDVFPSHKAAAEWARAHPFGGAGRSEPEVKEP